MCLSFVLENIHPHDIGTFLDFEGVAIRTGHHCTQPLMQRFNIPATSRASFAMYNTKEEVDVLGKWTKENNRGIRIMNQELRELYQQVILDHNKSPRNFRKMENATQFAEGYNPLCGDHLDVFLLIEDGIVKDVSFKGEGCAISKASASLMTSMLKGKTVEEAEKLFEKFHRLVTGKLGDNPEH